MGESGEQLDAGQEVDKVYVLFKSSRAKKGNFSAFFELSRLEDLISLILRFVVSDGRGVKFTLCSLVSGFTCFMLLLREDKHN